jgi:molybdopterin-guanine dinucleotide biosynthesis protein MobB
MRKLISVVGWHNAGKTTVVEALIREYRRRGARVATIKHSQQGFDMDRPGTDTWRFAEAGSDTIAIASRDTVVWIERPLTAPTLADLVARLEPDIDVVIVEGFKRESSPKIEVIREATGTEPIAPASELVAVVSDGVADPRPVPNFGFGEIDSLVTYLEAHDYRPEATA